MKSNDTRRHAIGLKFEEEEKKEMLENVRSLSLLPASQPASPSLPI